ncbi:Clp protease-like protein [Streptococcus phage Javan122]|uniref:ATP-dependent Clp protease proteolytic subunit n=1 Tax=Streptococcus dysgalactiae subsp. equisimilis AC-2713 TaxID=759913 RepID=A0AB33R6F8_STREQ|nr:MULTISPECIES: head maturation protease, ClpP-related [Streptococcus]MDG3181391.1 Clp protease ClpP [Streptococcus suis]QBX23255.1 Clp protease-like protein [Streptococcus phage Javan122]ALT81194.1 peptidase [Streptococcus gallolyticus]WDM38085.1 Clp protease ClpP [Streptococcus parasuis]CCI63004.1 K01358 ATP-dependent Clp protease, protease subunit [Streptococcus dysgalactiae subsp. equisimilis AC-2713]
MRKFWNFSEEDTGRTLRLEGQIADQTWFGDEVTPQLFKEELNRSSGDIKLWINSPGGDVFAASQIYNMLMEYKGDVHVQIDSLAASAASVIAMAGTTVSMSPVAMMMIHNPWTVAQGEAKDMQKVIEMLGEIKESIINAYELRTGLSRTKLSHLMDSESWFNAKKAIELGFADKILFDKQEEHGMETESYSFSRTAAQQDLLVKMQAKLEVQQPKKTIPINQLEKRLNLLK